MTALEPVMSPPRSTLLVVDDDASTRRAIEILLQNAGYAVVTATDGRVAIALLDTNHIDLVLTDLVMPDKDGIQLLLEMRRDHRAIPVIAFSAWGKNSAGNYLKIAKTFGARAILEKPFSNEQLMAAIRSVLG